MILPPPTYKTLASSYKVLSCPSPVNPHAHYSRGKHHSGLFSSMPKFSCFRISYKWNRIVCILFGKASFTLSLIVRFIQVLFICSSFFFFLPLSGIPLCGHTRLSSFLMMDTWADSSVELLWIFLYKYFCGHMFSFLLSKHLEELLGHRLGIYLLLYENAGPLSKVDIPSILF